MELEENSKVNIHISLCCDSFTNFHPTLEGVEIKCNTCKNTCYIIKNHNLVIKSFINTTNPVNNAFIIESNTKLLKRSLYDKTLPYHKDKCKKCNSKQKFILVDKINEIVLCTNPECESYKE